METKHRFFYNALLLTAVTLVMRTVAVSFNVYVSNQTGAETMGLIALIGGVYGFAVTLATSGIQLATVRTVAALPQGNNNRALRRAVGACLGYAAFFGTLASVLLFVFASPIGKGLLRDARTVRALRVLALTLLPIALGSVLNGYFTAVRRAWKNAVIQVSEQAIKISLTTYFLLSIAPKTVEGAMLAVLSGGAVAESASLLLNWILYCLDRRRLGQESQEKDAVFTGKKSGVAAIALPVAISAYMRSGLLAIEHILIPHGLLKRGIETSAALAAYGALQSMALPILLYPAAILTSFSALLIPEMTEQQTIGNRREIRYIAGRVYQMTLLFSIGVSGVIFFLSGELGVVLYHSETVSSFLRRLAPLIVIMYLDTATDGMLKGLGEQVYSMNVNIIDALLSVVAVALLVPHMGIDGYLVTIYITEIFNAVCSITRLLRITGYRPKLLRLLVLPLFSAIGATTLANLLFSFVFRGFGTALTLTLHISFTVALYLMLLTVSGAVDGRDADWLLSSLCIKRKKGEKVVVKKEKRRKKQSKMQNESTASSTCKHKNDAFYYKSI